MDLPEPYINLLNTTTGLNMPVWLSIVIIILCLVGSFLFSSCENAFSCCNRFHFKVLADEGKFTGKLVTFILNKYDDFLITGLIGNNLVAVIISSISTVLFIDLLGGYGLSNDIASMVSTILMTFVVYEFGDMLPKFISKAIPNRMAAFLSYIGLFFYIIFWPVVMIFKGLLWSIKKLFRIKDEKIITEDEFKKAAKEVTKNGILEEDETGIINRTFTLDKIAVEQVLTPAEAIIRVNIKDLTAEKVNKIILNTKFSRIPIYKDNKDNIIGILTVREYFKEYMKDSHLNIYSILQDPYFVTKDMKIDDIFNGFNENRTHIAIVKDENDAVVGMITMEDILEELVGDIDEKRKNMLDRRAK